MADQMPRALSHRLDVELRSDLPYSAALERRWCSPVEDAIEIDASGGGESCVEILGYGFRVKDADRGRPRVMVARAAQHLRGNAAREVEVGGLRQRMHAGVGAPCPMDGDCFATELRDRGFERLLNREAICLALPPYQPGPVIFDR